MAAENKPTKEKLTEYLTDPNKFDCGISIFNPDVITMTDDTGTGYFCPPPQVRLFGGGWKKLFDDAEKTSNSAAGPLSKLPTSSNASKNRQQPKLRFTIGIEQYPALKDRHLNLSLEKKEAVNKQLYATNCAEKDYLSLKVKMYRPAKQNPESFLSKPISIVAEPSNVIRSGSTVAIFNKSQSTGLRYLHFDPDGNRLIPSRNNWSPFVICLVKKPNASQTQNIARPKLGDIHYGSYVKLIDRATGRWLHFMRIMPVLYEGVVPLDVITDRNQPVFYLEKCAFQLFESSMQYMSVKDDMIDVYNPAKLAKNAMDQITDAEEWTVMPIDETRYRFYEAMGPVSNPVTSVPTITGIKMSLPWKVKKATSRKIVISGSDFRFDHKIWFGLYELTTHFDSTNCIKCDLPTYETVSNQSGNAVFPVSNGKVSFPITITRNDGVVYGTSYFFQYNVKNGSCGPAMIDPLTEFIYPGLVSRI